MGVRIALRCLNLTIIIKAIAYNALPICDLVLMIMLKKYKKCTRVKLRQKLCILELSKFENSHMSKCVFCKFIQPCIDIL